MDAIAPRAGDSATGALSVASVSHSFGHARALDAVSFTLDGGITGLLGENGAGKSTLLRSCAGTLRPTSGSITVDGQPVTTRMGRGAGADWVAYMPQTSEVPGRLTAQEFVTYLTWMRGCSRKIARERAREALDAVNLDRVRDQRISAMSGGMQRRVWLAQALAADPQVLLLDEPSTGLDPRQRDAMVTTLRTLRESGRTVLLSSHIIEDVAALADRVLVLSGGCLTYDGAVPETLDSAWFLKQTGASR